VYPHATEHPPGTTLRKIPVEKPTRLTSPLLLVFLLTELSFTFADCIHASAATTDSVVVTIRVAPVAYIEFPEGFDFVLVVPNDHDDHHNDNDKDDHQPNDWHDGNGDGPDPVIQPVSIPFKVVGNARASLSATPNRFMRLSSGLFFGEALGWMGDRHRNQSGHGHSHHGNGDGNGHGSGEPGRLGYNIIVQFPIWSWWYARLDGWDGYSPRSRSGYASLPGLDGLGTPPLTVDMSRDRQAAYGVIHIVSRRNWTADGKNAGPGDYYGSVTVTLVAND
jgi:hypothetical protein